MPKRSDIESILLIGSGPIVIGQACEFDYSGTQAIKALKEEGYRVILVNSNPATIMTDPEFADRTYVEPITPEFVEEVIAKERPDAVLPTMGGQTALNIAIELASRGVFEKYNCELIGADIEAIKTAEDRELFREAMEEIGLSSAKSSICHSVEEAKKLADDIGYPLILRPSRTLGGSGGGVVEKESELKTKVSYALSVSPNNEVLIEESLLGWKEIELEVMRDLKDNVVIVCGIENLDPMGVHTGDSITVAPIQTLTDKEYQILREASLAVMRRIGVETGGSNVQFSMDPKTGRVIVIEMNPRVSRSSALASKATGFPIAKIAAKLAVGYTLDEISNDITKETPACFEPSIDYVVTKIPRFTFEKFPLAENKLGTQMRSVGEVMAFGRCFQESLQKALCSMEEGRCGFDGESVAAPLGEAELLDKCKTASSNRIWFLAEALRRGQTIEFLYKETGVDLWFLDQISELIEKEEGLKGKTPDQLSAEILRDYKSLGFSDTRLSQIMNVAEKEVRSKRVAEGVRASFKTVDTCAGEFQAFTPYLYSSYDGESEAPPSSRKKIMILGSGPNRIGQGIEFDYCCVHAVFALEQDDYETIMVNCNPETVSTDYDTSDRLYFEPLTFESVMEIVDREKPDGVIVQFGGQTPLKLAADLAAAGVPIVGTSVEAIEMSEDRKKFSSLVERLGLQQPEFATASSLEEALEAASRIGFPLMMRPSFVLGGRAMRVVYSEEDLRNYMQQGVVVSNDRPVLLDHYLHNAIEIDLDAVCDGTDVAIAGVMEHIERAGVHSGDSSCCLPPQTLSNEVIEEMKRQARILALEIGVRGLMNVQFAVTKENEIYILEVNPRASRTVPFVSKATGTPWAKVAARVMCGKTLKELEVFDSAEIDYVAVKACVFPFSKFQGVDTILGPEMKSTGEVMGIHSTFAGGFAKAQFASSIDLPESGRVFLSVTDRDKEELIAIARELSDLEYVLVATSGTADFLESKGFAVEIVNKVREGSPHVVDMLGNGDIDLVVNTPEGVGTLLDSRSIRLVANEMNVPTYTTMAAATAAAQSMRIVRDRKVVSVCPLQEYHRKLN